MFEELLVDVGSSLEGNFVEFVEFALFLLQKITNCLCMNKTLHGDKMEVRSKKWSKS